MPTAHSHASLILRFCKGCLVRRVPLRVSRQHATFQAAYRLIMDFGDLLLMLRFCDTLIWFAVISRLLHDVGFHVKLLGKVSLPLAKSP